jgi:hypothetical protein
VHGKRSQKASRLGSLTFQDGNCDATSPPVKTLREGARIHCDCCRFRATSGPPTESDLIPRRHPNARLVELRPRVVADDDASVFLLTTRSPCRPARGSGAHFLARYRERAGHHERLPSNGPSAAARDGRSGTSLHPRSVRRPTRSPSRERHEREPRSPRSRGDPGMSRSASSSASAIASSERNRSARASPRCSDVSDSERGDEPLERRVLLPWIASTDCLPISPPSLREERGGHREIVEIGRSFTSSWSTS